jgi:hypothetical protein
VAERPSRADALNVAVRALRQGSRGLMTQAQLGLANDAQVVELERRAAVIEVLREMYDEEANREALRTAVAGDIGREGEQ